MVNVRGFSTITFFHALIFVDNTAVLPDSFNIKRFYLKSFLGENWFWVFRVVLKCCSSTFMNSSFIVKSCEFSNHIF